MTHTAARFPVPTPHPADTPPPRLVPARGRAARWIGCGVVVLALVLGIVLSIGLGARTFSPGEILEALGAKGGTPASAVVAARVARTAVGLAAGAALGLAGGVMQGLTRNPLADPGVLGVNAGATLAMVLVISLGVTSLGGYVWFALLGAGLAAILVYAVAGLGGRRADPVRLVIAGAAVTAGVSSWTTTILLTQQATLETFRFWQVGTIAGRGFDVLVPVLPLLGMGVLLALASAQGLNLMALGDEAATALGRRTSLDRLVAGAAIVLLAGTATALTGPLAFVGLLAAHLARMLVGADHWRLLPAAASVGAAIILVADSVGRVVLPPAEVQVGVMVAITGAPAFLLLLNRGRARL